MKSFTKNKHRFRVYIYKDRTSQAALVVKNTPANAGDVRDED